MQDLTPLLLASVFLLATPALADKPKPIILGASPQSQSDLCINQEGSGCKVFLGPESEDVIVTWKEPNHGLDKAQYYVAVTDGACDETKRYEDVPKANYPTKGQELRFTLKRDEVAKRLVEPTTGPTRANTPTLSFKICFDAGEHPNESQTGGTTTAADAKGEISFAVEFDRDYPKDPSDVVTDGLNKAITLRWKASESNDVARYVIDMDTRCHVSHKNHLTEIQSSIESSSYKPDQQQTLLDTLNRTCPEPTADDPPVFLEAGIDTEKTISEYLGKELENGTVYFFQVTAFDRSGNKSNPKPGIGIPTTALGPKALFPGDDAHGCSHLFHGHLNPAKGDWCWLAPALIVLARRRSR